MLLTTNGRLVRVATLSLGVALVVLMLLDLQQTSGVAVASRATGHKPELQGDLKQNFEDYEDDDKADAERTTKRPRRTVSTKKPKQAASTKKPSVSAKTKAHLKSLATAYGNLSAKMSALRRIIKTANQHEKLVVRNMIALRTILAEHFEEMHGLEFDMFVPESKHKKKASKGKSKKPSKAKAKGDLKQKERHDSDEE